MKLRADREKMAKQIGKKQKQSSAAKKDSSRAVKKPTPATHQKLSIQISGKSQKSNERTSETRERALNALSKMRREHLSLSKACREEHIKPATLRRYAGSALRQDKPGGRFRATAGDSFRRDLQIPTTHGMTVFPIYGSKNASIIAKYLNAVSAFQRNKPNNLASFKGKTVKARGQEIELLTDPAILMQLVEADALHFDQLYASATGAR